MTAFRKGKLRSLTPELGFFTTHTFTHTHTHTHSLYSFKKTELTFVMLHMNSCILFNATRACKLIRRLAVVPNSRKSPRRTAGVLCVGLSASSKAGGQIKLIRAYQSYASDILLLCE